MFSYVMLGVSELEKSRQFYDAFFGALGVKPGIANSGRYFYVSDGGTFAIAQAPEGTAINEADVGTTGFGTLSPQDVDAALNAGLAAGGRVCEEPAGWRDAGPDGQLYMGYLRDPSGNKLCVLHQPPEAAHASA